MPELQDVYTVAQAAVYLGISKDGVKYHLYKSGLLAGKTIGRDILFTRAELDRFKLMRPKPRGLSGQGKKG
jgi:excisionase family DNA binding protein